MPYSYKKSGTKWWAVPFLSYADCVMLCSKRETIRKTIIFFSLPFPLFPLKANSFVIRLKDGLLFLILLPVYFPKILFVLSFLISSINFSKLRSNNLKKKTIRYLYIYTFDICHFFYFLRCRKPRLNAQIAAQQVAQQYVPPPPPPKREKTSFKSDEYINDSSNDSCDVKSVSNTNSQSVENLHTTATTPTPTPTNNHVVIKKEKNLSHSKKSAR